MVTRALNDSFIIMRINHLQRQDTHGVSVQHDKRKINKNKSPPTWVYELEQAKFELKKVAVKIDQLKKLQHRHLHRPSLDDSEQEELKIQSLTKEINQLLASVNKVTVYIKSLEHLGSNRERKIKRNIVQSVAAHLQEVTYDYRQTQTIFTDQVRQRDKRLDGFLNLNGDYEDEDGGKDGDGEEKNPTVVANRRRSFLNAGKNDCKIN